VIDWKHLVSVGADNLAGAGNEGTNVKTILHEPDPLIIVPPRLFFVRLEEQSSSKEHRRTNQKAVPLVIALRRSTIMMAAARGAGAVVVVGLSKSSCRTSAITSRTARVASVWSALRETTGTHTRTAMPRQPQLARRLLSTPGQQPEFPEDIAIIDTKVRMKNAALGLALFAFVFGVANYSMHAVGQASKADDPLAALQQEAAAARAAQSKEMTETEDAAAMLEKFQKGEYDPDVAELEALEAEMAAKERKKPWWKVW
jgi:hypothetical protein